jgi:hypothetical protein
MTNGSKTERLETVKTSGFLAKRDFQIVSRRELADASGAARLHHRKLFVPSLRWCTENYISF